MAGAIWGFPWRFLRGAALVSARNPDLTHGYFPLDGGWFDRDYVAALILTDGALGVATILYLCCEAATHGGYEDGLVNSGRNAIALRLCAKPEDVEAVIARACEVGLLDDFEGTPARFTARISGWRADKERAATANQRENTRERTQRWRARHGDASVTPGDAQCLQTETETETEGTTTILHPPRRARKGIK